MTTPQADPATAALPPPALTVSKAAVRLTGERPGPRDDSGHRGEPIPPAVAVALELACADATAYHGAAVRLAHDRGFAPLLALMESFRDGPEAREVFRLQKVAEAARQKAARAVADAEGAEAHLETAMRSTDDAEPDLDALDDKIGKSKRRRAMYARRARTADRLLQEARTAARRALKAALCRKARELRAELGREIDRVRRQLAEAIPAALLGRLGALELARSASEGIGPEGWPSPSHISREWADQWEPDWLYGPHDKTEAPDCRPAYAYEPAAHRRE